MIPNKVNGLIFLGHETLPDIGRTCSLNDGFENINFLEKLWPECVS
uniref:Uncharacterized protein n=1 Tax=Sulfitobacter sp. DFL14 TaxID=1179815 RepID=I3W0N9_9RHOB|nr:hypothetical protein [Sulfitobacter sp. DFL14]